MHSLEAFLFGPIFALAAAIVFGVFGPRMSGGTAWLVVAAVLFGWAAFRAPIIQQQDLLPRALIAILLSSACGLGLLYANGWRPNPTPTKLSEAAATFDEAKLLAKYPFGFVIFGADVERRVTPYRSRVVLDKYDLDWSVVQVRQPVPGRIQIWLPTVRTKEGQLVFHDAHAEGPFRVGDMDGAVFGDKETGLGAVMWGEILAIQPNGIVFLIGFQPVSMRPQPKPAIVASADIEARRALRVQISELIQRGRIHLMNLNSIVQGRVRDRRKSAGELVNPALRYHLEVVKFAELHVGHDEAMRVSIPTPSAQYPDGITAGIRYEGEKAVGGYDLRTTWDNINSDLAALDRFLGAFPELKP